jgi:FkbM family methyltransferase
MEKSKSVQNMIPTLRGEVLLENGFSITTTRKHYPIVIKKDDPIVGSRLRLSGNIRSAFAETVISLAQKGEAVVEIGAHFGYNVINIAKKISNSGKYYAFEPNDGILTCLKKSVILNDLEDVVVCKNVAASDTEGTISIDDYLSITKKSKKDYTKPRSILVRSNTIDNELGSELRPISMLLIDIPGSEFSILKGAENTIAHSPNIKIVISIDPQELSKNLNLEGELRKFSNRGFHFYLAETPNKYVKIGIRDILLQKRETIVVIARNEPKLNFRQLGDKQ